MTDPASRLPPPESQDAKFQHDPGQSPSAHAPEQPGEKRPRCAKNLPYFAFSRDQLLEDGREWGSRHGGWALRWLGAAGRVLRDGGSRERCTTRGCISGHFDFDGAVRRARRRVGR